ncbi:Crp/Fnr family transcriptional regulator [Rufibacter latericius]|uniref:Crp/Fnr family transcriptional regulator n=1 Tax=Rufibacter latericius TaxID=2487040 RepID=A0A3M9M8G4_9BACT|nr:Crp/Fnr family transcriptional regulator [Rufibacter latericius]RNI21851.1 Crp/Fnr family transcriptional regulator [Rufibacter latericius]
MEEHFYTEYRTKTSVFLQTNAALLERYHLKEVQIQTQEILLKQGTAPKGVYILTSGLVKVTRTTAAGQLFTLGVFGPGEVEGDVEALMQMPYFCTVQTLTPCRFYHLSSERFLELLAREQEFNLLMHRSMASKMLNTSLQSSIQSTNRLYYTLLIVLRELSRLNELQISKPLLTELLGTSSRNLNRLLRQLEEESLLQVKGSLVVQTDRKEIEKRIETYDFEIH